MILDSFQLKQLKKGEYFLREGKIAKQIAFINSGLVRYFVHKNEEESTFEFTKEGEFIGDYQSFRHKAASMQNIQAIEDCELLCVSFEKLQQIFDQAENGNLLGRIIVEHRFDVMVGQLLSIYMHDHESRYEKFIKEYSDLAQRIPQYLIASYVGVKPESLSRIRKRSASGTS